MVEFILNNRIIETAAPPGMALLDFIRKNQQLTGSKLVCKEGECGACTVLVGKLEEGNMQYQSMNSCITPLVNAHHKHIVTIEGLNLEHLSPVQQAMADLYGTQCGFCTPGFVVSLTGYLLSEGKADKEGVIASIDGNICRCTGYKSIERAAERIVEEAREKIPAPDWKYLIRHNYIPAYFEDIPKRMAAFRPLAPSLNGGHKVGGGTDLYVQKPYQMYEAPIWPVYDNPDLKQIEIKGGICTFGASLTMGDLYRSATFKKAIPNLDYFFKLLSSTQIRNMSTIGGNLVNASPIGDFTVFLLALDSTIVLAKGQEERSLPLKAFYHSYKKYDLKEGEILKLIKFKIPDPKEHIHFEKVSQRKFFDIASVNFASRIILEKKIIRSAHLAVGGVGPIPLYLKATTAFLNGKTITEKTLEEAIEILNSEISPISDARGSADYKRLLARQLFLAQFLNIDSNLFNVKKLIGA